VAVHLPISHLSAHAPKLSNGNCYKQGRGHCYCYLMKGEHPRESHADSGFKRSRDHRRFLSQTSFWRDALGSDGKAKSDEEDGMEGA